MGEGASVLPKKDLCLCTTGGLFSCSKDKALSKALVMCRQPASEMLLHFFHSVVPISFPSLVFLHQFLIVFLSILVFILGTWYSACFFTCLGQSGQFEIPQSQSVEELGGGGRFWESLVLWFVCLLFCLTVHMQIASGNGLVEVLHEYVLLV